MISTKSLILKRNKKLVNVNGHIGSNKTQATTAHATSHGLNEWMKEWINLLIKYLAEGKPSANRGHLTKHKNVWNWPNLYKAS